MTVRSGKQPNDGKLSAADLKKLEQYRKDIQSIKKTLDNPLTQYEFTDESLRKIIQRLNNIKNFFDTLDEIEPKPKGYTKLIEAALECLRNSCSELTLARDELEVRNRKTRNFLKYITNSWRELEKLLKVW